MLPLVKLVNNYETVFFDSFSDFSKKHKILINNAYESILMVDSHTNKSFQSYSILTLLLKLTMRV